MKTCALVIGHKKSSPGAVNESSELTEFSFNDHLAIDIEKAVSDVNVQRVYRRTYKTLPDDINELNPDFIVSLHCNAYNKEVSGTEVLFSHNSVRGKQAASILQNKLLQALNFKDRGLKSVTVEDRGGFLLRYTNAPCVISEPFFIDNDKDLIVVNENHDKLVKAYAEAISAIAIVV